MEVGNLVWRAVDPSQPEILQKVSREQRSRLGHGVVLSKRETGNPLHPCVSVYYPRVGEIYEIAESLLEVIGFGRREY